MQIILEAWYGYANMGTVQPCYYANFQEENKCSWFSQVSSEHFC